MCGICGQYNFQSNKPIDAMVIKQMTQSLVHRGPDDEGYYISGPIGLGFRRLSIIDLTGGHQPMTDDQEKIWIVFNGEIYNFPDLREELRSFGHSFRTKSDTEVIIYGYKQWGEDVLNHLDGMFGLAIWDEREMKLIIARDAMGIKPIYYREDRWGLHFASEVRSILAAQEEKSDVDPIAVNMFLRYRYTPSPLTIYKGIKKLAPGTMLVAGKDGVKTRRWYRFTPKPFSPMKTDEQACGELLDIYKRSIKRHLISDVQVGLLLSGG
ncbi:asparagine synthetase B, partial [Candidatus Pacearchaeota archaeon]|nr:asparagine synthetase B [Candidatus Pacearchaeota archaeon]